MLEAGVLSPNEAAMEVYKFRLFTDHNVVCRRCLSDCNSVGCLIELMPTILTWQRKEQANDRFNRLLEPIQPGYDGGARPNSADNRLDVKNHKTRR